MNHGPAIGPVREPCHARGAARLSEGRNRTRLWLGRGSGGVLKEVPGAESFEDRAGLVQQRVALLRRRAAACDLEQGARALEGHVHLQGTLRTLAEAPHRLRLPVAHAVEQALEQHAARPDVPEHA